MCSLAASVAYFMKFLSIDLEGAIYSAFQITGILPQPITIVISFAFQQRVFVIFEKLTQIYDERKQTYCH